MDDYSNVERVDHDQLDENPITPPTESIDTPEQPEASAETEEQVEDTPAASENDSEVEGGGDSEDAPEFSFERLSYEDEESIPEAEATQLASHLERISGGEIKGVEDVTKLLGEVRELRQKASELPVQSQAPALTFKSDAHKEAVALINAYEGDNPTQFLAEYHRYKAMNPDQMETRNAIYEKFAASPENSRLSTQAKEQLFEDFFQSNFGGMDDEDDPRQNISRIKFEQAGHIARDFIKEKQSEYQQKLAAGQEALEQAAPKPVEETPEQLAERKHREQNIEKIMKDYEGPKFRMAFNKEDKPVKIHIPLEEGQREAIANDLKQGSLNTIISDIHKKFVKDGAIDEKGLADHYAKLANIEKVEQISFQQGYLAAIDKERSIRNNTKGAAAKIFKQQPGGVATNRQQELNQAVRI